VTHRINDRGTLVIDRVVKYVGRIKRASGTLDAGELEEMNAMLTRLSKHGRLDVLRRIQAGTLRVMDAYELWCQGRLDEKVVGEEGGQVDTLVWSWIKSYDCSDTHRQTLRSCFQCLVRHAGEGLVVGGLPEALRSYRRTMHAKPRMFNKTKAAVQAYLRDLFGKHHPLWMTAADIRKFTEARDVPGGLTYGDVVRLTRDLPTAFGAQVWTCVLTGMGPKEYYGEWEREKDRVVIHGTKARGRDRVVPLLGEVVKPTLSLDYFRRTLSKVGGVTPYQLRRTYAHFLEMARVVDSHCDAYMGHGSRTMRQLYRGHDVAPYLRDDTEKITSWLRQERRQAHFQGA